MDTIAIHRLAGSLSAAEGRRKPTRRSDAMVDSDERALARQLAAGDARAAQVVLDRHQSSIDRLVRRLLGWNSAPAADDIVQEVFVRAIESGHKFNGSSSLRTWLTRIAINECRAHRRKQLRRQTLLALWNKTQQPRYSPRADTATEKRETTHQVRNAIACLPDNDREVVVLFYLEELSTAEVAEALSIKPGAAATRLSRAREKLKQMLDPILLETSLD